MRYLWWAYVLCVLTLGIGRTTEKIMRDSGGFQSRYGPAIGAIVVAVGVIGYLIHKPIISKWIWRIVLVLTVLAMFGLIALEIITATAAHAPLRIHALIIAGVVLLIPAQAALYRYAIRSPELWERGWQRVTDQPIRCTDNSNPQPPRAG